MAETVEIVEVGPRDGLQNEPRLIPSEQKIALVDLLSEAGFHRIEVASFVNPKRVPQMADGAEVLSGIRRRDGVRYAALTPNMRGFEGAIASKADEIAIFASASEGFSQANIGCSIDESFERFEPVMSAAAGAGIDVRGYVSCVTDCPYDGPTAPTSVADVTKRLLEIGCFEVSLGDTIGRGTPEAVDAMLKAVLTVATPGQLAGHFHDTSGQALANIDVALEAGLRVFDAAVGRLGGCPFAPGAAGNVATEAVAAHLAAAGFETGLDSEVLEQAARLAQRMRGRTT